MEHRMRDPQCDEYWLLDPSIKPLLNVVTFGWIEDGRCGYAADGKQVMQLCPKPVASLRIKDQKTKAPIQVDTSQMMPRYVCKSVAAGSRHTLFLLIDTNPNVVNKAIIGDRMCKVMTTGLNQVGLCEERGYDEPNDVLIDYEYDDDVPQSVTAGNGTSFVLSKRGLVYSFGQGRFGVLGHGNSETMHTPLVIKDLRHRVVTKVSAGAHHAVAITDEYQVYSWGRNDMGQLGRGFESPYEMKIQSVDFPNLASFAVTDVSCGQHHTIVLVKTVAVVDNKEVLQTGGKVYSWGDCSRGQLGSGDAVSRMKPQENIWLTKLLLASKLEVSKIYAGGYHNLVLLKKTGQVIAWGANEYGQLGNGNQWDEPVPKMITSLRGVIALSAGLRHNMAVSDINSVEVFTWGYNGNGELGLGDTDVRLQPTHVSAIKNTNVVGCYCGDKHSVVITSHKPAIAKDDSALKPYFKALTAYENSTGWKNRLKLKMIREGLEPGLLDDPNRILPNQVGSADEQLKNDIYAKGLRYCLDTFIDKNEWRRKGLETCFTCAMKTIKLKSVCIACARNCLFGYKLIPYVRSRSSQEKCDCRSSGLCQCAYSTIRAQFDKLAADDKCIGPNQVRDLLKVLKIPYPVEGADVEDCLLTLAEGREDETYPRIAPVPFESWYRKYYDEGVDEDNTDILT